MASRNKCVTLRSINYLTDKSTGKKKKMGFLIRSNIDSLILKSDEIICAMKACNMDRFTLSN